MRTTIILDDTLFNRIKPLISKRGLSEWINNRVRDFLQKEERRKRMAELEKAYARVSGKPGRKGGKEEFEKDFEPIDMEDWPEW